jgi:hypothetical protein
MAEGGDLQAIREVADRLDGKAAQGIERGDVSVEVLSDRELFAIISGSVMRSDRAAKSPEDLWVSSVAMGSRN